MNIAGVFSGLVFVFLGYGYLCYPDKISKLNTWLRDHVVNDRILITKRKQVGVLLILIGIIAAFLAMK